VEVVDFFSNGCAGDGREDKVGESCVTLVSICAYDDAVRAITNGFCRVNKCFALHDLFIDFVRPSKVRDEICGIYTPKSIPQGIPILDTSFYQPHSLINKSAPLRI
jgi:hypothetical protein